MSASNTYNWHNHPGTVPCSADCPTQYTAERPPSAPAIASGGTKADAGKLGVHLLPTRPLEAITRVLDRGAIKYAPDNWRKGIAYTRVFGAVLRHLWLWWRGVQYDTPDGTQQPAGWVGPLDDRGKPTFTNEPHLACAGCALLFLLEYELGPDADRRSACDDRPEKGA